MSGYVGDEWFKVWGGRPVEYDHILFVLGQGVSSDQPLSPIASVNSMQFNGQTEWTS